MSRGRRQRIADISNELDCQFFNEVTYTELTLAIDIMFGRYDPPGLLQSPDLTWGRREASIIGYCNLATTPDKDVPSLYCGKQWAMHFLRDKLWLMIQSTQPLQPKLKQT
jgi:hypothetical protein